MDEEEKKGSRDDYPAFDNLPKVVGDKHFRGSQAKAHENSILFLQLLY